MSKIKDNEEKVVKLFEEFEGDEFPADYFERDDFRDERGERITREDYDRFAMLRGHQDAFITLLNPDDQGALYPCFKMYKITEPTEKFGTVSTLEEWIYVWIGDRNKMQYRCAGLGGELGGAILDSFAKILSRIANM